MEVFFGETLQICTYIDEILLSFLQCRNSLRIKWLFHHNHFFDIGEFIIYGEFVEVYSACNV